MRNSQVLRLSARITAAQMRVTKETGRSVAHDLCGLLAVGIGPVTAGIHFPLAEETFAAANSEWDDDPVSDLQVFDRAADLNHLAHILVAKDISFVHLGHITVIKMEIRSAYRGRRYLNDCIRGVFDRWIRNILDPYISFSIPT